MIGWAIGERKAWVICCIIGSRNICQTNERTYIEEKVVGYRGISVESTHKWKILVGRGARTCVKEKWDRNGIPNHPSKGPV